jgi:hypothetical protein
MANTGNRTFIFIGLKNIYELKILVDEPTKLNSSCFGGASNPFDLSCSWKYLNEDNSLSIFWSSSDLKNAV